MNQQTYVDSLNAEYLLRYGEPVPNDLDGLEWEERAIIHGRLRNLMWERDWKHNVETLAAEANVPLSDALLIFAIQELSKIVGHASYTADATGMLAQNIIGVRRADSWEDENA